jgi:hypothetical protein
MPLTDDAILSAKPREKRYKLFDGGGLHLILTPTGGKWWRFSYTFNGKQNSLSVGVYPQVSLRQARARRNALRKQVAQGIDPAEARRAARASGNWERIQAFLK